MVENKDRCFYPAGVNGKCAKILCSRDCEHHLKPDEVKKAETVLDPRLGARTISEIDTRFSNR
jgi:hypothetical protein